MSKVDLDELLGQPTTQSYTPQSPYPQQTQTTSGGGISLSQILGPSPATSPSPAPAPPPDPYSDYGFIGGALRFLSGAFEWLQLPSDMLITGTTAALKGENPVEALGRIEYSKYAPFGQAPNRPYSGEDMAKTLGLEGNAARWVGFGIDLFYDPLLAGSWIRTAGRVASGLGAKGVAQKIFQAANRTDQFLSLSNVKLPAPVSNYLTRQVERVATFGLRIPENTWEGGTWKTLGEWLLPAGRVSYRDAFHGGTGRADELVLAQRKAMADAQVLAERALEAANRTREIVQKYDPTFRLTLEESLRLATRSVAKANTKYAPDIADALMARAYDFVDKRALSVENVALRNPKVSAPLPGITPPLIGAGKEPFEIAEKELRKPLTEKAYNVHVEELRKLAQQRGLDPDEVANDFRQMVGELITADVLISSKLSMVDALRGSFIYNAVHRIMDLQKGAGMVPNQNDALNKALDMWQEVIAAGLRGDDVKSMRFGFTFTQGAQGVAPVRVRGQTQNAVYLNAQDLFGELVKLPNLDISTFFKKLSEGHLRRTYGMFVDFDEWVRAIRHGAVVPSKIIEDTTLTALERAGFGNETNLVREYIDLLVASRPERGVAIRQSRLASYLVSKGVPAERTREFIGELIKALTPRLDKEAEAAANIARSHAKPLGMLQIRGLAGGAFEKREDLTAEVLERLGELVDPIVSIEESGRIGRQVFETQDFLRSIYQYADTAGLIGHSRVQPNWVYLPENSTLLGPMAGKWVHPWIKKEIYNAIQAPIENRPTILRRFQSAVSANLLAGLNVTTANVIGNILLAALYGYSPLDVVPEIARAARDWRKQGDKFEDLLELHERVPIFTSLVGNELIQHLNLDKWDSLGLRKPVSMEQIYNNVMAGMQEFAKAPFGQKWLGTELFAQMEDLTRLAVYRIAKRNFMAQGMSKLEAIEEAAQEARFVTFDYASLPELLKVARNLGVVMFPGFPYFVVGRTLRAVAERPGTVAAIERLPEAIWNALGPNDDPEKYALYASLDSWMRDGEQMVPLWKDDKGRWHVMPISQLTPTGAFLDERFWGLETLGGVYRPIVDALAAITTGTGKAYLGQRYGQKVFNQSSDPMQRLKEIAGFLWNNYAPTFARSIYRYNPVEGPSGLAVELARAAKVLPAEVGDTVLRANEILRRKAEKDLYDSLISATVRPVYPVDVDGDLPNIYKAMEVARTKLSEELSELRRQANKAALEGRRDDAIAIVQKMEQKQRAFAQEWLPLVKAWGDYVSATKQPKP